MGKLLQHSILLLFFNCNQLLSQAIIDFTEVVQVSISIDTLDYYLPKSKKVFIAKNHQMFRKEEYASYLKEGYDSLFIKYFGFETTNIYLVKFGYPVVFARMDVVYGVYKSSNCLFFTDVHVGETKAIVKYNTQPINEEENKIFVYLSLNKINGIWVIKKSKYFVSSPEVDTPPKPFYSFDKAPTAQDITN